MAFFGVVFVNVHGLISSLKGNTNKEKLVATQDENLCERMIPSSLGSFKNILINIRRKIIWGREMISVHHWIQREMEAQGHPVTSQIHVGWQDKGSCL